MNIHQATTDYEKWMRSIAFIIEPDLQSKHKQMKKDLFMFFRGTFYRWVQFWPELCKDVSHAPAVVCSGDLHVGSFGTWRDSEGRLCWGVTDFDEAHLVAYTNDVVRLATSVKIENQCEGLSIRLKDGCDAILEGYRQSLRQGGCPIVLAEQEAKLEKLGVEEITPPQRFWEKLDKRPAVKHGLPASAKQAIENALPDPRLRYKVVRRAAGLGSLGQRRFVAIARWQGAYIAREAKEMIPSSWTWCNRNSGPDQSYYQEALKNAVRSHDPYQQIAGVWMIRRLSPDSNPIEIDDLPARRDEYTLLQAMGSEVANVHLGTRRQARRILSDLQRRKANWLRSAAKQMAKAFERDWKDYKNA